MSEPADKFKVGFYKEEDGTFTAFIQIKQLPDEEAGKRASTWLGNLLVAASGAAKSAEGETKN